MKKLISVLLVLAGLLSFCLPAAASNFRDVSDTRTGQDVAVLQALGVVSGMPDGTFQPNGLLTRAQFCKMAVICLGKASSVEQNGLYTIFPDVRSGHWAAGYVNTAAKGDGRIISGYPDGTFRPEETITYAQAVTILMRMLGYADADVSAVWPNGYLNKAASVGLTDEISLSAGDAVTRAKAAGLFCNLLGAKIKGGESIYLTKIAGSVVADAVFLSNTAKASDGTANAVKTSTGTYKTAGSADTSALLGCRGTLALDASGRFLTFLPDRAGSYQTVTLFSCGASSIKTSAGETISIPSDAAAFMTDKEKSTYAKVWVDLRSGDQVTLYYNAAGQVEYIFVNTNDSKTAMVARNIVSGNPFASLTEGVGAYRMLKNGVAVDAAAIRRYDVATYDAVTKTVYISDRRITGICQTLYPNAQAPTTITLLGKTFELLSSAMGDLVSVRAGDSVTLLLTMDDKVAGVVSSNTLQAHMVGIATAASMGNITVELLSGIQLSGSANLTSGMAAQIIGQLVTVGSYSASKMSVVPLRSGEGVAALNVRNRMLGTVGLAANVQIYEQVGNSALTRITPDDLTQDTVPATRIKYVETDYAGKVSILVLNDVTGDRYTYGFFDYTPAEPPSDPLESTNAYATIDDGTGSFPRLMTGFSLVGGAAGGLVQGLDNKTAAALTLSKLSSVPRAAFSGEESVSMESLSLPISDEVKCYIRDSGSWVGLKTVLAYADSFSVYYDRAPEQGGKVRMVVAD